jgi:hypothetical protein
LLGWVGVIDFSRASPLNQVSTLAQGIHQAQSKGQSPVEAFFTTMGGVVQSSKGVAPSVDFWLMMKNAKDFVSIATDSVYEGQMFALKEKEKQLFEQSQADSSVVPQWEAVKAAMDKLELQHSREGALKWLEYLQNNTSLPIPGTSNSFFLQMVSPTILWQMVNDLNMTNQEVAYESNGERYQPLLSTMQNLGLGEYVYPGTNMFNYELYYSKLVESGYLTPEIAEVYAKGFRAIADEVLEKDSWLGFAYSMGAIPSRILDTNAKWNEKFKEKPEIKEPAELPRNPDYRFNYEKQEADQALQKRLKPKVR